MSQGQPVPLAVAEPIAEELTILLWPACDRIAVAGSIRRRKAMVADIEIVAVPTIAQVVGGDLWGTPQEVNLLTGAMTGRLVELLAAGEIGLRQVDVHRASGEIEQQTRQGEAYQALVFRGLPVDLFIVRPPADWGVIYALRTGPGDWNTRLVTDCHRYLRRVEGGRVYRSGQYVPCPEERDFFAAVGQAWVEPEERAVGRVRIEAQVSHAVSHATANAADSGGLERPR